MKNNNETSQVENGGKDKMLRRAFTINESLWESCRGRSKAEGRPISWVIRELLKKWLNDEIKF